VTRVPQHPLPGKMARVETTLSIAEQKAVLAELDRQQAVIDAKKHDKNGNYQK
jgi:hypothetical protein